MSNNIGKLNIEIGANGRQAIEELNELIDVFQKFSDFNFNPINKASKSISSLCHLDPSNLNYLQESLSSFFTSLNNTNINIAGCQDLIVFISSIKQLGQKGIEKAINNIPAFNHAMKLLFNGLSELPEISDNTIRMTNSLANFAQQGSKVAGGAKKIIKSFNNLSVSVDGTTKKISKFKAGFLTNFRANILSNVVSTVAGFIKSFVGNSLEYASSLVETENVTENTFKHCASVIEQFSKSAITSFGMNELEAKKMAGRYQAMGTAMGESVDRMSSVSVAISKLAGDYASFYNLSVEETSEKFNAIFTGAAKPLRQFGIDLTRVTLEQYAQQKGITKSFKAMTQLEKAQLRYNYIVDHSSAIMGDFARTQDSYANQTKVLAQQLQDLFGSLGTIAINVLTPIIKGLNEVIARLRVVAKYVADVFSKTFGFQQVSGGAVAYDDLTESVEDYGDAVEKANKKQNTTGIDELNIINQNESQATEIQKASDALGDWNTEWSDFQAEEESINADGYVEFFKGIYNSVKPTIDAIESLFINNIKPFISNLVTEIKNIFNQFVVPLCDYIVGNILPKFINTIEKVFNNLNLKELWKTVRETLVALLPHIKEFLNGIVDFYHTIAPILNKVLKLFVDVVTKIVKVIGKIAKAIDPKVIKYIGTFVGALWGFKKLSGIGNIIYNLSNKGLGVLFNLLTFFKFDKAASGILTINDKICTFGKTLGGFLSSNTFLLVASALAALGLAIYDSYKKAEEANIEHVNLLLAGTGTSLDNIASKKQAMDDFCNSIKGLGDATSSLGGQYLEIDKLAEKYLDLAQNTNKTEEEMKLQKFYADKLLETIPDLSGVIDDNTGALQGTARELQTVIDKYKELAREKFIAEKQQEYFEKDFALEVEEEKIKLTIEKTKNKEGYEDYQETYRREAAKVAGSISGGGILGWSAPRKTADQKAMETLEKDLADIQAKRKEAEDIYNENMEAITAVLNKGAEDVGTAANTTAGVINDSAKIIDGATQNLATVGDGVKVDAEKISNNIIDGFIGPMPQRSNEVSDTIKDALYDKPQEAITGSNAWNTHSPSKTTYELADNIIQGLVNGINEFKQNSIDAFIAWATELLNSFKGTPELGVNYDYFMEQAHQIIQGFAIGVDSNKNLAINAINNLKTDILNTFTNYGEIAGINAITFDDYARLINEGFAEGINKWGYIAKEAVRIWAEEILAEFEDEMDIESPSKKFYKDGGFVVQGFNNAIKDGIKSSVEEVKNWGANIESAFNKYVNNNAVNIPVGIEAGGIIGNIASQNQNAYENAIRLNREYTQQSQQPINISLKVDSREIARANYKGQKELGYRIKE